MEKTLEDLKAVRKLLRKRRIEAALVIKDALNDESIAKLAMIHAAVAALDKVIEEGPNEREYQAFFV